MPSLAVHGYELSNAALTVFVLIQTTIERESPATATLALVLHWCHLVGLHGCQICNEEDERLLESKLRSEAMPGTRCVACILEN